MNGFTELAVPALLAALAALLGWHASRPLFAAYVFQRHNYRDRPLPTGVGILVPLAVAAVVGLQAVITDLLSAFSVNRPWLLDVVRSRGGVLAAICLAFSLLGLLDDLGGVGESGGFRGHFRALVQGRLTTGAVKAFGGPLVALALLGSGVGQGRFGLLREAAIVCLAANLVNLLDRAPGRATKFAAVGAVGLVLGVGFGPAAVGAVPVAAALGLLGPDLREECMLGDAGANAVGAGLGYGVVVSTGITTQWIVLGVLVLLNAGSELVSYSKVIDAVPPLRWFDRLGSLRAEDRG